MRRVVYSVAASLDGYIADPDGGYDWIPDDPEIDWEAFAARFDTILMGRRTFEAVDGRPPLPGKETVVFSRSLTPVRSDSLVVTDEDPGSYVARNREREGGHVWLMGGGRLFRTLLEAGEVDEVEVAVVPVLLGDGVPLLPRWGGRAGLALRGQEAHESGLVLLRYALL